MGYVGPIVVHLRRQYPNAYLVGFDTGLFAHCLTTSTFPEVFLNEQRFGDVRDITSSDLAGFDAIVHLVAVSNDPIGNKFEAVTDEINYHASVQIARAASTIGVRNFVFASSCSIYGAAETGEARTETSWINPLKAYARSKASTAAGEFLGFSSKRHEILITGGHPGTAVDCQLDVQSWTNVDDSDSFRTAVFKR
jgi:hypothetical protein